eukprot:6050419-Prymnesium_polylepis.1
MMLVLLANRSVARDCLESDRRGHDFSARAGTRKGFTAQKVTDIKYGFNGRSGLSSPDVRTSGLPRGFGFRTQRYGGRVVALSHNVR